MANASTDFRILGATITGIRPMSKKELQEIGWEYTHSTPVVLELNTGIQIYAQSDDEGNDSGVLIAYQPKTDQMVYLSQTIAKASAWAQ